MTDPDSLFALLEADKNRKRPPVSRWNPSHVGISAMRIGADGRWFHQGSEIRRPEMVRLFATILRRDGAQHYLVTPVERLSIEVDDAPFLAVDVEAERRRQNPTARVSNERRRLRRGRCRPPDRHERRVAGRATVRARQGWARRADFPAGLLPSGGTCGSRTERTRRRVEQRRVLRTGNRLLTTCWGSWGRRCLRVPPS